MSESNPRGVDRRSILATVPAAAAVAALTITTSTPAAAKTAETRRPECLADLATSREDH